MAILTKQIEGGLKVRNATVFRHHIITLILLGITAEGTRLLINLIEGGIFMLTIHNSTYTEGDTIARQALHLHTIDEVVELIYPM